MKRNLYNAQSHFGKSYLIHLETKKQTFVGCVSLHHPRYLVEPSSAAVKAGVCFGGFNGALQVILYILFILSSFTDVYVGCPGCTHSARVLAISPLYKMAEEQDGHLFPREVNYCSRIPSIWSCDAALLLAPQKLNFFFFFLPEIYFLVSDEHPTVYPFTVTCCVKSTQDALTVNGVEIPVHLVGNTAYPLKKWLMKGFTDEPTLTPEQRHFNSQLSSARTVVEKAFERLKGRWRCLLKRTDVDYTFMPDIVTACCILHNVCELNKEEFLPQWTADSDEVLPQPDMDLYRDRMMDSTQAIRDTMVTIV